MKSRDYLSAIIATAAVLPVHADRPFNTPYTGAHLNRVAFPIGGLGSGMFCLEGTGAISHMSVRHNLEFFHEPVVFAALCVLGDKPEANIARVVEGPVPDWKFFGAADTGRGAPGNTYGLPRFRDCRFDFRFPFGNVRLRDEAVPLEATITGFSPFIPGDADSSSLPAGALEYKFRNTSKHPQRAVFSLNSRNFMGKGPIGAFPGGFVLHAGPARRKSFAFHAPGEAVSVDHCWFKGGWWDPMTITWTNIQAGKVISNPPGSGAPGASLFIPFKLAPGEERTIRLLTTWYVPTEPQAAGVAFREKPSAGSAPRQQEVSGFLGKGLVNSFDPGGDAPVGVLCSPSFSIDSKFLHFLVGGGAQGKQTCVEMVVGDEAVRSVSGKDSEQLQWTSFNLGKWQGKQGQIRIIDNATGPWGHILADHFIFSDEPIDKLKITGSGRLIKDPDRARLFAEFDGADYGDWKIAKSAGDCCPDGDCDTREPIPTVYVPWYTRRYKSLEDAAKDFVARYDDLRARSGKFSGTLYDTSLPPEVIEAVAANLSILKSPTVLRQHDGRLWLWEGCNDGSGCCAGSCTHVWNYAQAICHLFPDLERGLRQTEFFEGLDEAGRQAFRQNLPIRPGGTAFDACDGQLGGIIKTRREWRISGDDRWLAEYWPQIRRSLDYAIGKWDPRRTGLLEESHHNTYDINYFGPNGHCGSFYIAALAAAVEMGTALGEEVAAYRQLLEKGKARMEAELWNGEYFIQKVAKDGLDKNFGQLDPDRQASAYREVTETVNRQGPKYQYGNGILSDGILGLWMARTSGMTDDLVDPKMVESHLLAIHKYNFREDLSTHANPQRPSYALGDEGGLLLCSWPEGDKPLLPFVYSDEVWTGIEYQVASHLMMTGHVAEGLEIVRACRKRYDGIRRNPMNEYECGHWYGRALASFSLLQGLTGMWYDAGDQILRIDSRIGNFRAPLFTARGFGTVEFKDGKAKLAVTSGEIPVKETDIR